jgi:hypothetical protein
VRFLGTFLADPTLVPDMVIVALAAQLDIADPSCLLRYGERPATVWEHAGEIRRRYGYRDFGDQPAHFQLVRWLYARAWVGAERPSVLFDLATARLVERKILLPGVSVLARLVAQVRDRAALRLWQALDRTPTPAQRARLDALVVPPEGQRQTGLDRLRRAPPSVSASGMLGALHRLDEVRALGVGSLDLTGIPSGRLRALARYASAVRAQAIARMPAERRIATLPAFARHLEVSAQDDALTLLDALITDLFNRAMREGRILRLRRLHDLDAAALRAAKACRVVLDPAYRDQEVRAEILAQGPEDQLLEAVLLIEELARPADDRFHAELDSQYSYVRRFVPALLRTITFKATPAGQPVLDALDFLHGIEGKTAPDLAEAPRTVARRSWKRDILDAQGQVDRRAYTFCTLEALQEHLRRRDVYVLPAERWGDPRARLLSDHAWEQARPRVCRSLGWSPDPGVDLVALAADLDATYRRIVDHLPANEALRIERIAKQDRPVLTPLDRLEEPASLVALRDAVAARLPRAELPEVLLEIQALTGFADAFTHISEGNARAEDLTISICAVLVAQACNIGLEAVARADVPALTRGRLAWVQQNYLREETLTRANARLVEYQNGLRLAQLWGGGEVASADGLRFVVPVRTINAGPNAK